MPRPAARLCLRPLEDRLTPADLVVTVATGTGAGTLHDAFLAANKSAEADTIRFGFPAGQVATIQLSQGLPALTGDVVLDGFTQAGSKPNSLAVGSDAVVLVEVDGVGQSGIRWANNTNLRGTVVRGLSLGGFNSQAVNLSINGGTAENVRVEGNFIGLRANGTTARPNGFDGVVVGTATDGVVVGGTAPASRNVISSNGSHGVAVYVPGVQVLGNYIGTTAAGTDKRANSGHGVFLNTDGAVVGGPFAGAGNLISGNDNNGVWINNGRGDNLVQGNRIGTNAAGTAALGNKQNGIRLNGAGTNNLILGNLASGNLLAGMSVDTGAGSIVRANLMGTDAAGLVAVPNLQYGLAVGNSGLTVGGPAAGQGNLISGNGLGGVQIFGSAHVVQGNRIGLSAADGPLGNAGQGVRFQSCQNVQLGTPAGGGAGGNVIAHNQGPGVLAVGAAFGNRILGNSIFANAAPGGSVGIELTGSTQDRQKPPELIVAQAAVGVTNFTGRLVAGAGKYRVEVFANPPGEDEGRVYLGSGIVTVTATGSAPFNLPANAAPPGFIRLTATATSETTGDTSEFTPVAIPMSSSVVPVLAPADPYGPRPNNSQNQAFVKGLYRTVLGRDADSGGLTSWTTAMSKGATPLQITQGFWNSPENRARQVDGYYYTFLGRGPDEAGRNGWINNLVSGAVDEAGAAQQFLLSPEAIARGGSTGGYVDLLYQAVLGRTAGTAERADWVQKLDSGAITRTQLVSGFVRSVESYNRILVSYYWAYLRREASISDLEGWQQVLAGGGVTLGAVAVGFIGSNEFYVNAGGAVG